MRVVSIHPARDPVSCGNGPVRIGSAPDDEIMPAGAGVDPHHLQLIADARGLVLTMRPGCQRVYVNARAVRERALLRYGDTVTLGANKFLITTDTAPPQAAEPAAAGTPVGPVALRIASGAASGQRLAVMPELRLGAGTRHFGDAACVCRVVQSADGLVFEADSEAPRVNGWHCRRAMLQPGDQIVLGGHRLVVEAPSLQCTPQAADVPLPRATGSAVEPDVSPHTEIWWLIAAATVLAVLIALFLYFRW